MGKGRFLKSAERACARKSRFETAASAEAFVEQRYRSYRCVVCGGYHLTSGRGERPEPPEPRKPEPPGPKLGDLDWSAVLDPQPKKVKIPPPPPVPKPAPRVGVVTAIRKDGRAMLVVEGRLVKSGVVDPKLRAALMPGTEVEVDVEGRVVKVWAG